MSAAYDVLLLSCLGLFLLLFAGRTIQLRRRGIQVVTMVRGKPLSEALPELLFVLVFPVWLIDVVALSWPAGPLLPSGWDPSLFAPSGAIATGGALMLVASVGLFAWSLVSFGASWRVGVDRDRPGELVTSGAFAWSRNPIFVAMDLFLAGAALMTGRVLPVALAVGFFVGVHRQIRIEERFLAQRYGGAYAAYRARVYRYLGRRSASHAPRMAARAD